MILLGKRYKNIARCWVLLKAFPMKTAAGAALILVAAIATTLAEPVPKQELDTALEKIREEHELPALGGIAVVDGEVKAIGAVGLRKFKGREKVTVEDKWHIGSCTKSMTATLAATFVEEGKLKWDSTVGEVLGRKMRMRDEYEGVTLKMLVTNRSGLTGNIPNDLMIKAALGSGRRDVAKRRKQFAEDLLKLEPDSEPGTRYGYSNAGFVVAGVMMETVSGKSWEKLMQERLFNPLKMESAGFGGAATRRREDQPWGHRPKTKPIPPGPGDDNPDVLGPAGTVHCSLLDLARYVEMHALREVGPVLRKPESFELLQTAVEGNDDYACGWVVMDRPWANGPAIFHNGSNTMNYCVIWFAPKRKFAAIAVTNVDNDSGPEPCDAVVSYFITTLLAGDGAKAAAGAGVRKVSPFSGVRWEQDAPVVKVGKEWFTLVSLDGIAAEKIVKFCKSEHGDKWQKRFGEDLVEVLEGMGHEPGATVDLVVKQSGSSFTKTLKGIEMTRENREAIRDAR